MIMLPSSEVRTGECVKTIETICLASAWGKQVSERMHTEKVEEELESMAERGRQLIRVDRGKLRGGLFVTKIFYLPRV